MKSIIVLLAFVPAIVWAGPLDGTWVTQVASFKITGKPYSYLVADGMFTCDACYPGLKIKADGTDQKVTGHVYYDTASAKILDSQRVQRTTHKDGKLTDEYTLTVSADGNSMSEEVVSYEGTSPTKAKTRYQRVAPAPAGAHALSGSWQLQDSGAQMSLNGITWTYKETPGGLQMSTPTGMSFDAKFDGKEYLTVGDIGKTMVSLKRINPHTIQETDTRDGSVTDVILSKVSADGKTLTVVDEDKLHDNKITYSAEKKSL